MKTAASLLSLAILLPLAFTLGHAPSTLGQTQRSPDKANEPPNSNQTYDAELAKSLGADSYGMKNYVFCTLVTGKEEINDEEKRKEIFAGHFSNMGKLADAKKLVLAGPLVDAHPKRGIYIFNVTTIEEAEELVKTDPAVKAGVFDYELTKLYCSAALMQISEIHATIQEAAIE